MNIFACSVKLKVADSYYFKVAKDKTWIFQ